ncbi:MAG: DNA-3-methyladenine glycosylase [Microthrixaceae bacterium]
MSGGLSPVDRGELVAPSPEVAPRLLNKLLVVDGRVGRIVEVEAYMGPDDPASHAYRGETPRTASMFGRPGLLYTYLSYGIHTCANVSTGETGSGQAVLLRALEPVAGLDAMRVARPAAHRDRDLANGPGKLCAAMGVTLAHDGTDLCSPESPVRLCRDDVQPPKRPVVTRRVGITRATERPWRFLVPDSQFVSKPVKHEGPAR